MRDRNECLHAVAGVGVLVACAMLSSCGWQDSAAVEEAEPIELRSSFHAYVDIFNALNIILATFIWPFGGPILPVVDYVPPRLVRLGLGWRF